MMSNMSLSSFRHATLWLQSYKIDFGLQMAISALKRVSNRKFYLLAAIALTMLVALLAGTSEKKMTEIKTPQAPVNLLVETADDGVVASWNPSKGADSYTLFWGTEKGEFRKMFETTETAVLLKGLDTGKMYNFAVTASNTRYESHFSQELFFVHDTSSGNSSDYLSMARELVENNRDHEALAFMAAAIRLDPQNAESYRTRASLFEKLGRKKEARTDLHTAETLFNKKPMTSRN